MCHGDACTESHDLAWEARDIASQMYPHSPWRPSIVYEARELLLKMADALE